MRRIATAAVVAIATICGALTPAPAQRIPIPPTIPIVIDTTTTTTTTTSSNTSSNLQTNLSTQTGIPPLGLYVMGGIACAAVSPMIGTVMLGREMTANEVGRSTLSCFLGPIGWLIGPQLFPFEVVTPKVTKKGQPRPGARQAGGRNISIPPPGQTSLVANEVLTQVAAGASNQLLDRIASQLQLTQLETQTFALTGRTLQRWRIDGNRSVAATLRAMSGYPIFTALQPNFVYRLHQNQPAATQDPSAAQYVVNKLHLVDAHRITSGDNVLVAVIDSKIDVRHPDLAGVIAGEYDVVGTAGPPHAHGTGMAGAIAAHSKLIGVAPKVRLLAVRAFTGEGESAQSTTFNILKSIDWAAGQNARIINMSFAGPSDAMVRDMLGHANARGIVLIAAVGNAGPRSPPLFPAADSHVIGVTATDADDKLLPAANRGPQVAVAAPGVEILAAAPDGTYQVTSGTSIAAAHASGVAALLLARKPGLKPDEVRRLLIGSAHATGGKRNDVGAGVIDALGAVNLVRN